MRLSNLLHLVQRNIRMRRFRMLSARLGIGIAVFFLALGLGIASGVYQGLRPALEKVFPERKIIVRPPAVDLAMVRLQTKKITDEALLQITDLDGVKQVDPQMPMKFPLHAEGSLGPLQDTIVTEIVIHGVPRSLVADGLNDKEPFDWTLEDTRPCPVIVSSYFLDLYNLGISESNRLPKLNESALLGKDFELVLGESAVVLTSTPVKTRRVLCEVAGFTRDPNLAGIALPLSAVRDFNQWYYGQNASSEYNVVQIEVQSVSDLEEVGAAIQALGFAVAIPGKAYERWHWVMRGALGVVVALGLGVLLIALSNVVNTFTLVMTERREEIGLLQALGATRGTIRMLYLTEIAWMGLSGAAGGALVAIAGGWLLSRPLAQWTATIASLETISIVPTWSLGGIIVLAVALLSLCVTWPVVTRATHHTPAQLLRE